MGKKNPYPWQPFGSTGFRNHCFTSIFGFQSASTFLIVLSIVVVMYREMKQQLGGFCYHFWTHAVPKLDRYRRKDSADPLAYVKNGRQQQRILKTLKGM